MKYEDLTEYQQQKLIETMSHWLEFTVGNIPLSGRITNRRLCLSLPTTEYRRIYKEHIIIVEKI